MSRTLKITFIVIGSLVGVSILLLAGILIGRGTQIASAYWPGGMMNSYISPGNLGQDNEPEPYGYPYGMGSGMMGMTGGAMMGGYGPGMMGGFGGSGLSDVEPLTLEQAREAVEGYLSGLNNADLEVGEIMIFDNHAYAQIIEKESGIGAMEVLVDPVTLSVYPEHGPNMMWNLKYGMMSGWGNHGPGMMGGGMMGGYGFHNGWNKSDADISADMPVSPEQAVESAQRYLEEYLPGLEADEHADPFYGYYTLHVLNGGEVAGMLSVNGFTQQVFLHTWHGDFIEMSGD